MSAKEILHLVWKATEIFFVISIIFLFLFIVIKAILDKRVITNQKDCFTQDSFKPKNNYQIILCANQLGQQTLESKTPQELEIAYMKIKELNLSRKIYEIYSSKSYSFNKIYLLPILATLRDKRYRKLYLSIIDNAIKKDKKFEYVIWSLFGLALSSKDVEDMKILYLSLEKINSRYFVTQKFSQYFFSESFLSVNSMVLTNFMTFFPYITLSPVAYGFIKALKSVNYSYDIYKNLELFRKKYSSDVRVVLAVLDIYNRWQIDITNIVKEYYRSENVDIRRACAKVDLNLVKAMVRIKLMKYLSDEDRDVRLNFVVSLTKLEIDNRGVTKLVKSDKLSVQECILLLENLNKYQEEIA